MKEITTVDIGREIVRQLADLNGNIAFINANLGDIHEAIKEIRREIAAIAIPIKSERDESPDA